MATRHDAALMKVITVYSGMPPSQIVVEQLGVYIESQIDRAMVKSEIEIADRVCEHLHDGPPKMGVMCKSCYEAEKNAPGVMEFVALGEINRRNKDDQV